MTHLNLIQKKCGFVLSYTLYDCIGDCNFCVKNDYHLTNLNPEMGSDLNYKFVCDYGVHEVSYKGTWILQTWKA